VRETVPRAAHAARLTNPLTKQQLRHGQKMQLPCVLPEVIGPLVFAALRQYDAALATGALVVVDVARARVRMLPL